MRILIPTAGSLSWLRLTIDAYRFTSPGVPITLVAFPPDRDTRDWLLGQTDLDVVFVNAQGNARNLDIGIKRCLEMGQDDVIITNDDVVPLTMGWPELLQEHIDNPEWGRLGAVGARSNNTMRHQLSDRIEPIVERAPFLSGIWLWVSRQCLEQTGGNDPDLKSPGWLADLEWTYRMVKQGWTLLVDRRIFVWHWGSLTLNRMGNYNSSSDESAKWNLDYMYRKYPELKEYAREPVYA